MKTISVPATSTDINSLLEQARKEDVLLRAADGTEFIVTVVDEFDEEVEFDEEIVRTRQNAKLMALLEQRAQQTQTVPLAEVKRQLGLNG